MTPNHTAKGRRPTDPEVPSDREQLKWQNRSHNTASNDSIAGPEEQDVFPLQDQLANSGLEFDGETNF